MSGVLKASRFIAAGLVVTGLAGLLWMRRARIHLTPPAAETKFREADRNRATRRGLSFIIEIARDPKVFEEYGADLLWCLYSIASTSADSELSQSAWQAARERAREYRRLNPVVPADADAADIFELANGSYTADLIGVPSEPIKDQIRRVATRFSPQDYLSYDPSQEPPPSDLSYECERCGLQNSRGATVCRRCRARLEMRNRYSLWLDSLITTYTGDRYGVVLGAHTTPMSSGGLP